MTSQLAPLGRLRQFDSRNLNYQLRRQLVPTDVRRKMWYAGPVLDQGNTSECVGHAGYGWLNAGPVVNKKLPFSPTDLYHWAQDRDEWPGRDYEGTSTLGLMKSLVEKGFISEYRWALDAETLVSWLLTKGPVLCGTSWFLDMFMPDKMGFIAPTGDDVGGHEYYLIGADRDEPCPGGGTGAVRMINSWGRGWNENGRAWISFRHLDWLIKNQGEAVVATEVKI